MSNRAWKVDEVRIANGAGWDEYFVLRELNATPNFVGLFESREALKAELAHHNAGDRRTT